MAKLLYILQWTIFDSASECLDAENGLPNEKQKDPSRFLFPLSCIQIFIFLLAPLSEFLTEKDFENVRLENGLSLWRAIWDHRQPELYCFSAPVKPRRSQLNALPALLRSGGGGGGAGLGAGSGAGLGAGLGGAGSKSVQNFSRGENWAEKKIKFIAEKPNRRAGVPSTATKGKQTSAKKASNIIRSISGYKKPKETKTNENFLETEIRKKSLEDLVENLKFVEEESSAAIEVSDRAPLVALSDICGGPVWPRRPSDATSQSVTTFCDVVCEFCNSTISRTESGGAVCKCGTQRCEKISESPQETQSGIGGAGQEIQENNDNASVSTATEPQIDR